jgi:hypothetical protein
MDASVSDAASPIGRPWSGVQRTAPDRGPPSGPGPGDGSYCSSVTFFVKRPWAVTSCA